MGSIWGKSGDSFWTSEDIEVGHFGSEENHGGYLGQGRRFRHFKQVRILKGVVGDYDSVQEASFCGILAFNCTVVKNNRNIVDLKL